MSIYDLDINFVSEKLTPPELRQDKRLAWLRVLLAGLQRKHEDIFDNNLKSFKTGDWLNAWSSAATYVAGDQVKVGIARYEALQGNGNIFPVGNTDYWLLIEKDFVGTDARKQFYSGKMSFEYALNLYLNTFPTAFPTIYIATQGNANPTFMLNNNVAPYLNYMPVASNFQQFYMANVSSYSAGSVNFIIYVPLAVYNALGSDNTTRTNVVRTVADKYNTAGMTYSVVTY